MMKATILLLTLVILPGCLIDNQDHSKCAPALYPHSQIPVDFFGEVILLPFTEKNQKIFTEEDIFLTDSDSFEDGVVRVGKLWQDRTFYYKINPNLPNKQRVYEALDHWKNNLGDLILFVEAKEDSQSPNYVEFIESEGCWSNVGMRGGRQEIGLEINCKTPQVIHEIGHAIGLWHEQSRNDRDDYVEVKWCNIPEDKRHNFLKVDSTSIDFGEYDFESIMHYTRYAFTLNKFPTLTSKTDKEVPLFHSNKLSEGDISSIRCAYGDLGYCQNK